MNRIITIGRQFGSGGREIGEKLAKRYNIKFYDKDLLKRAAKESGICSELFENNDEKPTGSFLYNLVTDTYSFGFSSPYIEMPLSHKVFLAQFDTIKKIAQEGPCVIVGRCADYALAETGKCLSVFIHAGWEDRIERIKTKFPDEKDPAKIKDMIIKTDKARANYYNYYSSKKWGRAESYDLCVNSSILGIDGTVDMISAFIDKESVINEKNK
ncbi:MAG: cytidylate kinase-like family protein [Lachnospiraceae bacterium]|nr:cytidylate kinase-like family protein [Lachnospiraceae bacterium]